ncbi:MAG: tyrosine-type recombinase/integrase [Propionibacteriales bacterium]|nr:tyrosine-type recombinase/integrase [Propionibacteriales bacterium]
MLSHDVVIWRIRNRKGRRRPYELRWVVARREKSKSFLSRALADDFRADLLKAAKRGELFDTDSGLPESMLEPEAQGLRWYDFARQYVGLRWPRAAAKTRAGIVEDLAIATSAMLDGEAVDLSRTQVRRAMVWALMPSNAERQPPVNYRQTIRLLSKGTLQVSEVAAPQVRRRLVDILATKLDGTAAGSETVAHRRRTLNTALEYAVEIGELSENPLSQEKRKRVAKDVSVDRRVVASPRQARELFTALTYVGSWRRARGRRLVAFFATLYYAGLRPAEAVGLRLTDCYIPDKGWGLLTLTETRPMSGSQWTDDGTYHDQRGLKQREQTAVREVPIPPTLVGIIRQHLDEFGTAADSRLFANERGALLGGVTIYRAWREARRLALTPAQYASPLAQRPYDLRHAALSTWLNAGVDPTDVAERAGNSVEVLLRRYAKCIDGRQDRNNRLIEQALLDDRRSAEPPAGSPKRLRRG